MNRLHHLKQTLIQNIKDNEDYEELEFIVLDYNSDDGMENWAKNTLMEYIGNGRLIYFKTTEPQSWNPSHSKNLAFKLATGDIVCSIWADYYTGRGFAHYVNNKYQPDGNVVLTPIDFYKTNMHYHPPADVLGKVCVKKTDFLAVEGFDERMNKHGFEDYDFINRLEMNDVKRVLIEDFEYLKFIGHSNNERYFFDIVNFKGIFINYISPSVSEVLLVYNDERFEKGTLIDNFTTGADDYRYAYQQRNNYFEYTIKELQWQTGIWKYKAGEFLMLTTSDSLQHQITLKDRYDVLEDVANNKTFYKVNDGEVIENILTFKHFYSTRWLMEENLKNRRPAVNYGNFGKAAVFKNFCITPVPVY